VNPACVVSLVAQPQPLYATAMTTRLPPPFLVVTLTVSNGVRWALTVPHRIEISTGPELAGELFFPFLFSNGGGSMSPNFFFAYLSCGLKMSYQSLRPILFSPGDLKKAPTFLPRPLPHRYNSNVTNGFFLKINSFCRSFKLPFTIRGESNEESIRLIAEESHHVSPSL